MGELETKCVESWKKICPEYEIKRWDESNFDINCSKYVKEAYEAKKYAFVSDYARLVALYEYGGIYFDTDVELIKSPDGLLENKGFLGLERGAPTSHGRTILPATGLGIGCEPHSEIIRLMTEDYKGLSFLRENGTYDMLPCTQRNMHILTDMGFNGKDELQNLDGFLILPTDYLAPLDFVTGKLKKTDNTVSIHLYNGSWHNRSKFYKFKKRIKCTKIGMLIMRIKEKKTVGR